MICAVQEKRPRKLWRPSTCLQPFYLALHLDILVRQGRRREGSWADDGERGMDPGDAFISAAGIFKWDPRAPQTAAHPCRIVEQPATAIDRGPHAHQLHHAVATEAAVGNSAACSFLRPRELEEVFGGYGVRYATVARMGELGFTASTLVGMTEAEVDDMMATLAHLFRWDLLLGERYGIKAALRAERRRLHDHSLLVLQRQQQNHNRIVEDEGIEEGRRRSLFLSSPEHPNNNNAMDALSQEGLSEEPVHKQQQQDHDASASGGDVATAVNNNKAHNGTKHRRTSKQKKGSATKQSSSSKKKQTRGAAGGDVDIDEDDEDEWWGTGSSGGSSAGGRGSSRGALQRQREHPFVVTEPGEVARAKKNGLDYLFHLYEQCRHFLLQVQAVAKEQGHKCPTKVTNQVFRYAKKIGANYINKPKMRHYVHCYALHCLDEEASNALRRAFKERGQHVGLWRQACYKPVVDISAQHGWDIDAVFSAHPRLSIWYVPTKLRQLCHLARSNANAASCSVLAATSDGLSPTVMF